MNDAIKDLSGLVLNHPGLDGVRERVQKVLFDRFRVANPEEREIINSIMDAESLFFKELRIISGEQELEDDVIVKLGDKDEE